MRAILLAAVSAALWFSPQAVRARDLYEAEDGTYSLTLDSALKSTALVQGSPGDPTQRQTVASLWRARFTLEAKLGQSAKAQFSYEQRLQLDTSHTSAANALFPSNAPAPFRLVQLQGSLVGASADFVYLQQLDRAHVALQGDAWLLTIGRQAIGLGRGTFFGAVDVLAPFLPTTVDREWRRGVDAIRAEISLTSDLTLEAIAAFDRRLDESAYLAKLGGRVSALDGSLIGGMRGKDVMLGLSSSAALGDAAFYLDAAEFRTPHDASRKGFQGDWIPKVVSGGSYVFSVGSGLSLNLEYHYNGFGVRHLPSAVTMSPDWRRRALRGDFQSLGRHELAVVLGYDLLDELRLTLSVLQNAQDGSGLAYPLLQYAYSDTVTLVLAGFLRWGAHPRNGELHSEYGSVPVGAYLQIRIYD